MIADDNELFDFTYTTLTMKNQDYPEKRRSKIVEIKNIENKC